MQQTSLYCLPSDVYDDLGIDGTEVRFDDRIRATGQTIRVTVAAAAAATSLSVTAIQFPLLAGSQLVFDGGGLTSPVEVVLSSVAQVGDTGLSVNALPSALPVSAFAVDNGLTLYLAGLALKACQFGTGRVKLYCCQRYDDSQLYANSTENGSVKYWATACAKLWISRRLTRPTPDSVKEHYEETMEELRQVQASKLSIEDVPTRTASWPSISNVMVDVAYDYARVRVEQPLSDMTPTQYPQYIDWNSAFSINYLW